MLSMLNRSIIGLFTLALLIAAVAMPVVAADPPLSIPRSLPKPVAKEIELETEVDLVKLLNRDLVFPAANSVTDSIWDIKAGDGRVILRMPLTATKPTEAVRISGAAVKVRGGRFICWQLIDAKEETTGQSETLPSGAQINPIGTDSLPAGVPRMTRSVELDPDGTISWKMDRAIPGAKVIESGSGTAGAYVMKLDPAAINALNPGTPPRVVKNAGESPQDYLKRKLPLEEEYKRKAALYRDVRTQLLKLPDEFKGPAPATLWAVYESRSNTKTFEVDGPAPLPWDMPFDMLITLQRIRAMNADGTFAAEPVAATQLTAPGLTFNTGGTQQPSEKVLLAGLQGKVHPYTLRLVAYAVTMSPYLAKMEEGDERFQIVQQVMAGKDSVATGELMKYLATKPSKATAALMQSALKAGLLDAKAQLGSITGMIATLAKDPTASVDSALLTMNQFLADPKGPPASELLSPFFELAKSNPALSDPIAKGLRVDATGARRDETIVAILNAAATDRVAMGLVDARLLGAEDQTLVERTLTLISRAGKPKIELALTDADEKPIAIKPGTKLIALDFWSTSNPGNQQSIPAIARLAENYASQGVSIVGVNMDADKATFDNAVKEWNITWPQAFDGKGLSGKLASRLGVDLIPTVVLLKADGQLLWRGRVATLERAINEHLRATTSTPDSAIPAGDPKPMLVNDIGIIDLSHSIFSQLGNAKLRNLAWGALRHMRMMPLKSGAAAADREKWTNNIVDLAVAQTPTPTAAVAFLAKHDEPNVPDALAQIVIRGTEDASTDAAQALYGSGWPLDQMLAKLGSESDRPAFGMRFYENINREAIYSVGLLRDKADGTKVANWFGGQIANGILPHPAQWKRPYETDDKLLNLVNVSDAQLADGAVGTLVASAGGSGLDTVPIAGKLRANKNATIPELTLLWNTLRKELFAAKLKGSAGTYIITLRTGIALRDGNVGWGLPQNVGSAAMKVEGAKVTLGSVTGTIPPDDTLSFVLPFSDVKSLDAQPTGPINMLKVVGTTPVAFTPLGHNGWYAQFTLTDGQKAQITLMMKN